MRNGNEWMEGLHQWADPRQVEGLGPGSTWKVEAPPLLACGRQLHPDKHENYTFGVVKPTVNKNGQCIIFGNTKGGVPTVSELT